MKKKEKILIGILLILLVIEGSIYINVKLTNKGNIIQKQEINKGQITETSGENAYVSTQSHLAEVNAQNQEITDLNTQIGNTTVTADRLLKGYTAYKNGQIITGTMEDRGNLNWAPTTSTTYTVPAGYYSGGTLNSAGAYNTGWSAGVTAADNRANANSINYQTGYNAGYNAGKSSAITATNTFSISLTNYASGTPISIGATVGKTYNIAIAYTSIAGGSFSVSGATVNSIYYNSSSITTDPLNGVSSTMWYYLAKVTATSSIINCNLTNLVNGVRSFKGYYVVFQ